MKSVSGGGLTFRVAGGCKRYKKIIILNVIFFEMKPLSRELRMGSIPLTFMHALVLI